MSNEIGFGIRVGYEGKAVASGAATTRDEIKKIGAEAQTSGAAATQALDRTAISAKQTAAALRGVPAQFTDIFTSIAAGQNPMQVMLQQGGQLKDMFGGIVPAARALGGYIAGLVNPYTVAAAAVGGLAYAYHRGAEESSAYTRALILSGNAAGTTAAQLSDAARQIAAATGGTQGAAAEALTLAIGAGIPGAALNAVADAAVRMEQVTGKAIDDTVAEFAKLARDPVAASIKLSEQYNYLTLEVYRQIKALEEQGRHTEAVELAMKTYADTVAERSGEITRNLSPLEDKWLGIKVAAKGAIDAIWDIGRPDDQLTAAVEKVQDIKAKIRDVEKNRAYDPGTASAELVVLNDQLAAARAHMVAVRDEINANNANAAAKAKVNDQNREAIKLAEEEARKKRALRAARPARAFDPEGDLEFAQEEAQRKAAQKRWLDWEKELAREAAAAQKEWSDAAQRAQQDIDKRLDSLDAQAAKAEIEVANYGLSAAAIERATIARLEERRAIDAGIDGLEESVAALDKEIATRKRLAAAADSKDALDANKKATEEMQRDWERMHDQLSQSLTDAIMDGGQSGGELLQNYFKTLILRPVIQGVANATVGAIGGAASQVLGINAGGSGGAGSGVATDLSRVSSGLSLAGSFGAFGGGYTAGSLGGFTAANAIAGTVGTAGGASAGTAAGAYLGAALPYIGAVLAIASIFGGKLFGGKESAPEAYINQFRTDGITPAAQAYLNTIGGMGTLTPFGHLAFATQHMKGDAVGRNTQYTNQYLKPVAAADEIIAGLLSRDEIAKVSGAFGNEVWSLGGNPNNADGALMRRFNRISDAIGGWVDKMADTTTGTLQERYTQLAQLLAIRGDEQMEQLANDMFAARGKWNVDQFNALAAGVQTFNGLFLDEADQLERTSAAMRKAFEGLNLALPESRDGFKDLVEGIDTSTQAGFDLYATLLDLAPTMDAYYDALKAERDIKNELADMENNFSTAVDYRRYQRVAANYDPAFAADYAYNISLGTIRPGAAGNGDLAAEVRALRDDMRARDVALVGPTQYTADTLRRWNSGGMPAVRT